MDLHNKIALVTGASRGIGRAIALALGKAGCKVMLAARDKVALEKVADEIDDFGSEAAVVVVDLREEKSIQQMIASTISRFGSLDILVNNAGLGHFAPVAEMTTGRWDEMFDVNLRGVFIATRAALPHLRKQGESFVVNIASLAGKNTFANGSGYTATKWGLRAFSQCLMLEERKNGVRVLVVCPGSVDTGFGHPSAAVVKSDAKDIIMPEDVAAVVLTALEMPQRSMVSEIDIRPTKV